MRLTDYKVRVLDTRARRRPRCASSSRARTGGTAWTTVGVSTDIIEASWLALVDSIEYKLINDIEKRYKAYM